MAGAWDRRAVTIRPPANPEQGCKGRVGVELATVQLRPTQRPDQEPMNSKSNSLKEESPDTGKQGEGERTEMELAVVAASELVQ